MPLREIAKPNSPQATGETYVVFYSSRDGDGNMWCPDCRDVEALVAETFGPDGPSAAVTYVGQRAEWKTPSNSFRSEPWNIQALPTIVKLSDGVEVGRLVEHEVQTELVKFVHEQ